MEGESLNSTKNIISMEINIQRKKKDMKKIKKSMKILKEIKTKNKFIFLNIEK